MRIQTTIGVSQPKETGWLLGFFNALNRLWEQLAKAINGNISFGDGTNSDNISGVWVSVLTQNVNFVVTHNLGRIPVGYLMVKSDAFENLKFISSTVTTLTLDGQNGGANILLFVF